MYVCVKKYLHQIYSKTISIFDVSVPLAVLRLNKYAYALGKITLERIYEGGV